MAVATVNAQSQDVVLMAKGNRLVERDVDLIDKVDPIDIEEHPEHACYYEKQGEDAGFGRPIGAARKYLSH